MAIPTIVNANPGTGTISDVFTYGFVPTSGNLLIVNATADSAPSISPPAGWSPIIAVTAHGSALTGVYQKVADGTETADDWWAGSGTIKWAMGILEINGQSATGPVDASGSNVYATAEANPASPSVVTTVPDCLLIGGCGWNNFTTLTLNAGLTSRFNQSTTGGGACGAAAGTVGQASAGASGTFQHTLASAQTALAYTIAIAPTGGGAADPVVTFSAADTNKLVTRLGADQTDTVNYTVLKGPYPFLSIEHQGSATVTAGVIAITLPGSLLTSATPVLVVFKSTTGAEVAALWNEVD